MPALRSKEGGSVRFAPSFVPDGRGSSGRPEELAGSMVCNFSRASQAVQIGFRSLPLTKPRPLEINRQTTGCASPAPAANAGRGGVRYGLIPAVKFRRTANMVRFFAPGAKSEIRSPRLQPCAGDTRPADMSLNRTARPRLPLTPSLPPRLATRAGARVYISSRGVPTRAQCAS